MDNGENEHGSSDQISNSSDGGGDSYQPPAELSALETETISHRAHRLRTRTQVRATQDTVYESIR